MLQLSSNYIVFSWPYIRPILVQDMSPLFICLLLYDKKTCFVFHFPSVSLAFEIPSCKFRHPLQLEELVNIEWDNNITTSFFKGRFKEKNTKIVWETLVIQREEPTGCRIIVWSLSGGQSRQKKCRRERQVLPFQTVQYQNLTKKQIFLLSVD